MYSRLRFVRLSAYGGSTLTYYKTFDSENSIGYAWRGRADFLLSRIRPFVAGGRTKSRSRPNGEIDVRPDRVQEEVSGGLAFDLGAHSLFYVSGFKATNLFENSIQDGIDLAETLTRDTYNVQGGLRTDITPLLSVQLLGSYQEDKFRNLPIRDGVSKGGGAVFRVSPEAAFTGVLTVSYNTVRFADPLLRSFKGVSGTVALAYSFLETGRLTLIGIRNLDYSLAEAEGYFIENSATLAYTHRLVGRVDAQLRAGRSAFDYSSREDEPPHVDTLDTLGGSLGYNLRNRTRVAVNYEYSRRRSLVYSDRNYQHRRAYLSWTFAF